jgi:hypothetical protein
MTHSPIVVRAFDAFRDELRDAPPTSLRGGNDIDSYDVPTPLDPAADAPTDTYLEQHAFWALPHLDSRSWRHYLPHLIDYALRHPDDPAMVTEGLVRSLRPPDRFPPRLASLNAQQEAAVRTFLETIARETMPGAAREEAQQALEEWWGPHPRARPTAAEIDALRSAPVAYRDYLGPDYRVSIPDTLPDSGVRDIPSERRRVRTWGGHICWDVPAAVAVNVIARAAGSFEDTIARYEAFLTPPHSRQHVTVPGARRALRLDGLTRLNTPAEPQPMIMVVAEGTDIVTLTIRAGIRDDARVVMERIAGAFEIDTGTPGTAGTAGS